MNFATLVFIGQSLSLVMPILAAGLALIWILRGNHFRLLNKPVDHGFKLGGRRVLGDNKTWRGVATYVVVSTLVCFWLFLVQPNSAFVHPVFANQPLIVGLVFSLSYVTGEFINSFVKRRLNIAAGKQSGKRLQQVTDNIDGMVVLSLALLAIFNVSIVSLLVAVAAGIILHSFTEIFMKRQGLKT